MENPELQKVDLPGKPSSLHPLTPEFEVDGDDEGATNICMRGFGSLLGQDWFCRYFRTSLFGFRESPLS